MAYNLAENCNFLFGFFSCTLPQNTIDMDLMVCTLQGIHTFRKDRNTQVTKCSPWGTDVKPFPSLQRKMMESLLQREVIINSFVNRSYQSRPKATPCKKPSHCHPFCQQVKPIQTQGYTHKRTQASNPYQNPKPKKINVGYHPEFMQRIALPQLEQRKKKLQSKPLHLPNQLKHQPFSTKNHPKYCAICSPLGKLCPNESHNSRLAR